MPRQARQRVAGKVVTLVGDEGKKAGELLVECALGRKPLSAMGGAARRARSGGIELRVDRPTWDAIGFSTDH